MAARGKQVVALHLPYRSAPADRPCQDPALTELCPHFTLTPPISNSSPPIPAAGGRRGEGGGWVVRVTWACTSETHVRGDVDPKPKLRRSLRSEKEAVTKLVATAQKGITALALLRLLFKCAVEYLLFWETPCRKRSLKQVLAISLLILTNILPGFVNEMLSLHIQQKIWLKYQWSSSKVLKHNPCELQKFGPGVGTLPQLEPPVVQVVVSNAKNQHQLSDNILPQIANKGGQNNFQTHTVSLSGSYQFLNVSDGRKVNRASSFPVCSRDRTRGRSPPSSSACGSVEWRIKCPSLATARCSATSWRRRRPLRDRDYPCPPQVCC